MNKRITFLFCFFLQYFSNIFAEFSFLAISDLHIGRHFSETKKLRKKLLECASIDGCAMALMIGDLTESGLWLQYKMLKSDWLKPLCDRGLDVYLCRGNHDYAYIKKKIPKRYFFIKDGVTFFCCGICPNNNMDVICSCCLLPKKKKGNALTWLRNQIIQLTTSAPIVIFFHYNLVGSNCNWWWSKEEKEDFYEVIRDYNVLAIFTGHCHSSYFTKWKNIPVFGVGGKYFAYAKCNEGSLDVKFIYRKGNIGGEELLNNYYD